MVRSGDYYLFETDSEEEEEEEKKQEEETKNEGLPEKSALQVRKLINMNDRGPKKDSGGPVVRERVGFLKTAGEQKSSLVVM